MFPNILPIVSFPSFHFVCVLLEMEKIDQRRGSTCLIVDGTVPSSWEGTGRGQGCRKPRAALPIPTLASSFTSKLQGGFQIKIPIDWHWPKVLYNLLSGTFSENLHTPKSVCEVHYKIFAYEGIEPSKYL